MDEPGRVLALIGSGETSPTMVTVHRKLLARLRPGPGPARAVALATPYAFQVNAADVSARTQRYFARSVGLEVSIAAGTSEHADAAFAPPNSDNAPADSEPSRIRAADWLFAGPGNPSYALAHWQAGPVATLLRERMLTGQGVTVLASAAAATAGLFTLPVYEIYKAGGALRWLPGLNVLSLLGLKVAVIPHFDNAEGRDYDTRYCYLGEHRLRIMERELPADSAILGIDEHTVAVFDLRAMTVQIHGRGGMTVRRAGSGVVLRSGTGVPLEDLRRLVAEGRGLAGRGAAGHGPDGRNGAGRDGAGRDGAGQGRAGQDGAGRNEADSAGEMTGPTADGVTAGPASEVPLPELMTAAERDFAAAVSARNADAMVAVILGLESAVKDWEGDTDEDQGPEQARAMLRSLIARLGQAAQTGLADPRERLRPAVDPLLALRAALRDQERYAEADVIRSALTAAGLAIRDTADGTRWQTTAG
jgi:hypothetical protein